MDLLKRLQVAAACGLGLLTLAAPTEVRGQELSATSSSTIDYETLRRQLRDEIKSELREELLRELEAAAPPPAAVTPDPVAEEGWRWEEPVRPELNLLEIDGYFRFRYDFFVDLDLGTYYNRGSEDGGFENQREEGPFIPGVTSPPVPLCNTDVRTRGLVNPMSPEEGPAASCFNERGESDTLGGANVRFRLEPILNVYEDIKIKAQIDILDNLVLGSTADGGYSGLSPLAALTQTQLSPSAGVNTIWRDSIRVKRVWGEYMTPLGLLSFGRMPNHFGMGISANDGEGLDQDFGDSVDRVQFAAQIGDFLIAPAFDWAASGPTSVNTLLPQGQPFDRDQSDDVDQYVLTITKIDSPEMRDRKLASDEIVFDFGTQVMYRTQTTDSRVTADGAGATTADDPAFTGQATTRQAVLRDAWFVNYSAWAELRWRKLTVTAEYAGSVGSIGDRTSVNGSFVGPPEDGEVRDIDINQHGGSLRGTYALLDDKLHIELMLVAASGDDAPGWGLFPLLDRTPANGDWDGNQAPAGDNAITNYRFDPDFIVDLIFWRQLVGGITDAFIVRPSIQYDLTDELGGRLDLIYSRSWFGESTPSGSFNNVAATDIGGTDLNLGFEADVSLFFRSERGFTAQLQYGIFIPMDGLDRQVFLDANQTAVPDDRLSTFNNEPVGRLDAQIAHTVQALLAITF